MFPDLVYSRANAYKKIEYKKSIYNNETNNTKKKLAKLYIKKQTE